MTTRVALVLRWLPAIVWMVFIFIGSTDLLSSGRTSRIIRPLLRWFNPNISESAVQHVEYLVRKTAHLSEYAILSLLLWRACNAGHELRKWNRRRAVMVLGIAFVYAVTDEAHQASIPSRYSSAVDVMIDSAGAALGLGFIWTQRR